MPIKIGGDPEFFLKDKHGNLISAIGVLKGSKHRPQQTKHGAIHRDNVLAEVNFNPAETADEFVQNIRDVLSDLDELINPHGLVYVVESSHVMPDEQLHHWEAGVFGCEGDFDAWGVDTIMGDIAGQAGNLRTAGGHVHLGLDNGADPMAVARACDVVLGLWSVQYDQDSRRRSIYGQAGKHRIKPYGVEYRTLSNFWLRDEQLMRDVFDQALHAAENSGGILNAVETIGSDTKYLIKSAINNSDVNMANELYHSIMKEA